MSVFDLTDSSAIEERARTNGITQDQVQPGFFEGTGYGVGMGLMRGGAKLVRAGALAGAAQTVAYEKILGADSDVSNKVFDFIEDNLDTAVDYWTPNAQDVGTLGRVMGSLSEIVAPLAVARGNPLLLMGSVGLNTTYDLSKQGVKPTTAVGVGMIDSAAVGLGFRLPFLGNTFAKKAATGAGGSLALGIGATAADQALLEAGGYDDIAKQYNPLDIEARTVDLLTGIAFGGIAQLQTRGARAQAKADAELLAVNERITRSDRDAALSGLNALHYQLETAPGRPLDESALIAHQKAMETAIRQLQEGRPVDVGESRVSEADFISRDSVDGPADGFVRMYHGGIQPDGTPRWLSPDLKYAEGYAAKTPGADVFYVDIPESSPLLRKVFDDEGTSVKSPYSAFDAPREIAGNLKRLAPRETPSIRDPELRALFDELGIRERPPKEPTVRPAEDAIVDTERALTESPVVRDGTAERPVNPAETTAPRSDAEARQQPPEAPVRADEAKADPDSLDVIAAERSVELDDIAIETGEVDADGKYKSTSAREALAAARQEVATAKREASAFEAAVACALSFGDA